MLFRTAVSKKESYMCNENKCLRSGGGLALLLGPIFTTFGGARTWTIRKHLDLWWDGTRKFICQTCPTHLQSPCGCHWQQSSAELRPSWVTELQELKLGSANLAAAPCIAAVVAVFSGYRSHKHLGVACLYWTFLPKTVSSPGPGA